MKITILILIVQVFIASCTSQKIKNEITQDLSLTPTIKNENELIIKTDSDAI